MNHQEKLLKSARNLTPETKWSKQGIIMAIPNVKIRVAKPSDARALNNHMKAIYASSHHLITREDEFTMSAWKQRYWIAKKSANPLETCLIATSNNKVVGTLNNWTDTRKRISHSTGFSVSVKPAWQCKGIGSMLIKRFIAWVKKHPTLERIELHVHSDNTHAIELYQTYGFELEGTRRGVIRYEDGRIIDDHIMTLWP